MSDYSFPHANPQLRCSNNGEIRNAPGDSQSPQASASTNSAIRACDAFLDGVSQKVGMMSRTTMTADKFPAPEIPASSPDGSAGNQNEPGRWAVVCNQVVDRSAVRHGACSYVCAGLAGNGYDRIPVVTVSREGRLIRRWEDVRRLKNFRPRFVADQSKLADEEQILTFATKVEAAEQAVALTQALWRETGVKD